MQHWNIVTRAKIFHAKKIKFSKVILDLYNGIKSPSVQTQKKLSSSEELK